MSELTDDIIQKMLEIAKGDLLNPLYEQVVGEYEEAALRLDMARKKLAQAVKLTDNDKLQELLNPGPSPEEQARVQYYQAMMIQKMMQARAGK